MRSIICTNYNEAEIETYTYNKAIAKDSDGRRNSHKLKAKEEIVKIEDGMTAIALKKDFYAVQDIMRKNTENHNTFNAKEIYLLSGLIYCGECGQKMIGNISYYKKEVLENYIIHEMEKTIFSDVAISYLSKELTKFCDVKQKHMEDELKFQKNKLSKLEKEIENIFNNHKTSLAEKNIQLIKKFINLYIEKVLVYNDHIKVVFKLSPLLVECSHGEAYHK